MSVHSVTQGNLRIWVHCRSLVEDDRSFKLRHHCIIIGCHRTWHLSWTFKAYNCWSQMRQWKEFSAYYWLISLAFSCTIVVSTMFVYVLAINTPGVCGMVGAIIILILHNFIPEFSAGCLRMVIYQECMCKGQSSSPRWHFRNGSKRCNYTFITRSCDLWSEISSWLPYRFIIITSHYFDARIIYDK